MEHDPGRRPGLLGAVAVIGHLVEARQHPSTVEVLYGGRVLCTMPRLREVRPPVPTIPVVHIPRPEVWSDDGAEHAGDAAVASASSFNELRRRASRIDHHDQFRVMTSDRQPTRCSADVAGVGIAASFT